MRDHFVAELRDLASEDERIVLLTGDLGFSILEGFRSDFPSRFVNCGVAEQNMIGLATGLAEAGYVPFVYSIATFATLRPYELIRNGPVAHGLPVRVVGTGGGFDYGHNGISHYALEDYAVMRAQPGMAVISPVDGDQARAALRATRDHERPVYFRIGKGDARLPGLDGRFRLGRAELIGDGTDVALIATGSVAQEAVAAAAELRSSGVAATVAVVACIEPAPTEDLAELVGRVGLAVSVEAHYRTGGLGSLVAEVMADNGIDCRLVRVGVDALPDGRTGSQARLEQRHGLSAGSLVESTVRALSFA